jgi:uncharacterized protein (TIGR02246 family)
VEARDVVQAAIDAYHAHDLDRCLSYYAPDVVVKDADGRILMSDPRRWAMALDHGAVRGVANGYTAAWNSGSADAVAGFFAEDGSIVINRGSPWEGRAAVARMAAGFFADIPDLALICDGVRVAGSHVVYLWTFTGTHASSGKPVNVSGWEEWDLDADHKVKASRGWFDADDYASQTSSDIRTS